MRFLIALLLMSVSMGVFEKTAEAGLFFRGGPIRRLLFGGPIRRRMFGRPMMRRPLCGNCLPRQFRGPRCGGGIHGGRCQPNFRNFRDFRDFQNRNFRDLRDVPNFQDFERNFFETGDPFLRRNQFDSVFDPGFGLTGAPAAASFPTSPVSQVEKVVESLQEKYQKGIKPDNSQELLGSSWQGRCEASNGKKRTINFSLPEETKISDQANSALLKVSETEKYEMKMSEDRSELLVKITKEDQEEYCALERN